MVSPDTALDNRRVVRLLHRAIARLLETGCPTPRLDAEVIFAHTLNQNRSWLYAHSDDIVSEDAHRQFEHLIERRAQREPVAYITGQREFFGLTFTVTPAVLIPRPETELLVEQTLHLAGKTDPLIVDVGTGSGCIALSLAIHLPQARLIATDISYRALTVAQNNARRHDVSKRVDLVQADLLAPLKGPVDILVSNPPYISTQEIAQLAPEIVHYEPRTALTDAGAGLSIIERLIIHAPVFLKPGGLLLLEIGANQGKQVLHLAKTLCPQAQIMLKQDLAGRDRLLVVRFG